MKEFFKPWRRTIGVVMLLMACLFMIGWVRSFVVSDEFTFPSGNSTQSTVAFINGSVAWCSIFPLGAEDMIAFGSDWNTSPLEGKTTSPFDVIGPDDGWSYRFLGFGFGKMSDSDSLKNLTIFVFPYWAIVFLVTALSAYLLRSKPRNSTPTKVTEPTANEKGATS